MITYWIQTLLILVVIKVSWYGNQIQQICNLSFGNVSIKPKDAFSMRTLLSSPWLPFTKLPSCSATPGQLSSGRWFTQIFQSKVYSVFCCQNYFIIAKKYLLKTKKVGAKRKCHPTDHFLTVCFFSAPKRKILFSQQGAILDRVFHETVSLVGCMSFSFWC